MVGVKPRSLSTSSLGWCEVIRSTSGHRTCMNLEKGGRNAEMQQATNPQTETDAMETETRQDVLATVLQGGDPWPLLTGSWTSVRTPRPRCVHGVARSTSLMRRSRRRSSWKRGGRKPIASVRPAARTTSSLTVCDTNCTRADMICPCCKQRFSDNDALVVANFQIRDRVYRFRYCSQRCKAEHQLVLMREAGL